MINIFYNKTGSPIVYTEDECHIFLFTGKTIAYIYHDSIYDYNGNHLGFYMDGWIRDQDGFCVLFTKNAIGGPNRAMKDIGSVISTKKEIPIKKVRKPPKRKETQYEYRHPHAS